MINPNILYCPVPHERNSQIRKPPPTKPPIHTTRVPGPANKIQKGEKKLESLWCREREVVQPLTGPSRFCCFRCQCVNLVAAIPPSSRAMAMAGNLVCARPPTLPSPLAPSPNSATSNHTLGAAFRRTPHQGIGKHSLESGHRDGAGQFIDSCRSLKAIFNSERGTSTSANEEENDLPPAGCSRIKVELSKPLGIAFEDDKYGNIFVGEVIEGGNAYKSGLINAGDQLIATSAIIYNSEEDYQGVMVRKGMQIIRFNVRGERFETVMAAIGTHPAHVKVALEFQKCEPIIGDSINGPAKR